MSWRAAAFVSRSASAAAISWLDADGPDVSGGRAARFARDRGIQHERRHACGQRFERRQSESFVFGEECKHRGARIQRREGGIINVRADADAIGVPASASNRIEIDRGSRPILANDLELSVTARDRQRDRRPGSIDQRAAAGTTNQRTARSEHAPSERSSERSLGRSFDDRCRAESHATFLMPM